MRRSIVGISLLVSASYAVCAQTAQPLTFEAASLKPSAPNSDGRIMRRMAGGPGSTDPGQITYNNVTVKMLVMQAYNLKEYQVEGPDWIEGLGFDLVAKLAPNTTKDQMSEMMQSLLAERFKLTSHRETKQLPVYALVVGKGGSKMKEVEVPALRDGSPAGPDGGRGGPLPSPGGNPAAGRGPGGRFPGISMIMTNKGLELAGSMTMAQLAGALTRQMGRAVLDQTELNGTYDVDITWMPDDMDQGRMNQMAAMAGAGPGPGGPGGPGPEGHRAAEPANTLPQALQEKLGLRLDARKSTAEVLIVDRAERVPVEN